MKEQLEDQFTKDPPESIGFKEYYNKCMVDYKDLLTMHGNNEKKFQDFFERNPSFIPGSRAEFDTYGPSGHEPYLETLISQPKIDGIKTRIPDFMWLAKDSLVFSPMLVEIEAPNKKYFNKDGTPTSNFKRAANQLDEWQTVLSVPENVLKFHSDFNISKDLSDLLFEPYYILIYGRRSEYEHNKWLTQKRAKLLKRSANQFLMSYDRLSPSQDSEDVICSKVKSGNYHAKFLNPLFKLNTLNDYLLNFRDLDNAIDAMAYTTDSKKEFLKLKNPLLLNYLKNIKRHESYTLLDFNRQHSE